MNDYIACECPKCGGEVEHIDTDMFDDRVEENYRCGVCDKLVVFVFDRQEWGIEWQVAPPYDVYTEDWLGRDLEDDYGIDQGNYDPEDLEEF